MSGNIFTRIFCILGVCFFVLPVISLMGEDSAAQQEERELLKQWRIIHKELNKLFYGYLHVIHPEDETAPVLTAEEHTQKFVEIVLALPQLKEQMQNIGEEKIYSEYTKLLYLEDKLQVELRKLQKEAGVKLPAAVFGQKEGIQPKE